MAVVASDQTNAVSVVAAATVWAGHAANGYLKEAILAVFPGILSRRDIDSFLEPNSWLLLDGIANDRQAANAATEMVKKKQLEDQDPVVVTGEKDSRGSQPVIVMTDISAQSSTVTATKAATSKPRRSATAPSATAQQATKEGAK
jgi:hypothetical protein